MKLVVPTLFVDCLVSKPFTLDKEYNPGDFITLPFGRALFAKAAGFVGAIKDETERMTEAVEMLAIYGADAWFENGAQTIKRVADYLMDVNASETKN